MSAEISAYLDGLQAGDVVYPGRLAKSTGRDLYDIYDMLEKARGQNAVRLVLSPGCSACGTVGKEIYHSIADVPEDLCCKSCGRKLSSLDDMLVLYQKK